jgi:MFS family permease
MMTRVIAALGGGIAGVLLLYLLVSGIGWAWGPFYSSEEDMAANVKMFLAGAVIAALAGGWLAHRLAVRSRRGGNKRNSL